jgi:hypothetical protein
MDYSKLHWQSDFMSDEIYGEGVDEFVVGIYTLRDFPQITLYINTEIGKVIEVFLDEDEE